ncbi:SufE family protein [Parafilimonas terrae]|uniref:Cysteine desulfuration protein SufE n=1 Tax=Parafilimonas terrae TaxID=1465490 RepID=A0A1I5VW77_9BACT|nr:SufE family protein [Parafilimonas terrae]SFQ11834.1 cysteine desulfuration protein SufE [Parafilimonas terrae]
MHLNKVQDKIIEEFESIIDQVKGKFRYFRHFAKLGTSLPETTTVERTDDKMIKLTRSKVWLDAAYKDGKVYYAGDSDSSIIKGILMLYIKVFSGRTPKEIIDSDVYFTHEISLHNYLPPDRRSELSSVLQRMRAFAARFKISNLNADDSNVSLAV